MSFPFELSIEDDFDSAAVGELSAPGRLGHTPYELICSGATPFPVYYRTCTVGGMVRIELRFADGLEGWVYHAPEGAGRCVVWRGVHSTFMADVIYAPPPPAAEAPPKTAEDECRERWPDAVSGEYSPRCCRWPKSCSI